MDLSDNGILALACGGFGLAMLVLVVVSLREAAAMKRWPVARGRVLSSKVEEYRADAGSGNFGGPRGRMTLYRPVVLYEYEVGGQRYRGDRIAQSPGMDKGVDVFAQAVAKRYATGSAVDVRFNPQRPAESVLEPRVPRAWIFALAIAVGLLILAAWIY
jgi:phage terminase large subunit-like protein